MTRWIFVDKVMSLLLSAIKLSKLIWITEKAREFQKKIYFCFIDYAKAFARRSNQSILQEISPGCLLEGLMLKLKLQ